jgi:surfactin synthase thioesterase subunit
MVSNGKSPPPQKRPVWAYIGTSLGAFVSYGLARYAVFAYPALFFSLSGRKLESKTRV